MTTTQPDKQFQTERFRRRFGMSRWRMALVQLGLFAIIGGSLFDIATLREHWPFSPYPMYSRIELDASTDRLYLYGVPAEATVDLAALDHSVLPHGSDEFPLHGFAYTQPLSMIRLTSGLEKAAQRPDGDERLRTIMQDVLDRYETLRLADRHGGPALRGVRLYEVVWQLEPRAHNLGQPEVRRLLMEIEAKDVEVAP